MIGGRPEPVIRKLARVWGSGILGSATSPRSPLEIMNTQSQKGLKRYDFGGSVGIGLGIVAELKKSKPVYHRKANTPVFATNQSRSIPDPEVETEKNEEDYTFVTCHGPNKTSTSTRVYHDGDDYNGGKRKENIGFDKKSVKSCGRVVFDTSPARFVDDVKDFPESDFLSFCSLCRKTLHGEDIYMYRGEKAFCSEDCRNVEIVKEEATFRF